MPLSRQQYVSGIVSEMRTCHGEQAHAVIVNQAAAFRRTGNADLAAVWEDAGRLIGSQETRISYLADLGYIPDESKPSSAN